MKKPEDKVKCASCGSTKNVIEHHLSYYPEVKVPLCRKCHGLAHFSKKPAKTYDYYDIFKSGERPKARLLGLRGYIVGILTEDGIAVCIKCNEKFEEQEDLCEHFYYIHFVKGNWKQGLRRTIHEPAR